MHLSGIRALLRPIYHALRSNGMRSFTSSSSLMSQRYEWSYCQGSTNQPLQGITIGKLMEQAAEKYGNKEAFVSCHQNLRYTYEELLEKCDKLAAGLLSLGLQPGDRVGIWAPNCMEWIITQYATARVGMILVNINPAYRATEMEFAMKKVGVKALITAETYKTSMYYDILQEIIPELSQSGLGSLKSARLPELQHIIMITDKDLPGVFKFDDVQKIESPHYRGQILDLQDAMQFDDPINIQYTSGTTGLPKGVVLTQHSCVNYTIYMGGTMGYDEGGAIILVQVPLFHIFGILMGSMMSIIHGAKVVLPSPSFNAKASLETIHIEKCTSVYGTPTMFIDMLAEPNLNRYDCSSFKTGIISGTSVPTQVVKKVIEVFGCDDIRVGYGSTENSSAAFMMPKNANFDKRTSTVGTIQPQTEAKIIDDKGKVVRVGEKGELCLRGYCIMRAYWDDPEKTAKAIPEDRFYRSGDLAVMDEEGYVQIVGRIKDMIIRGGENIYPAEVEQLIHKHPKVLDVQVVGVPDERLGEQVCAWIKLEENVTATIEEIKNFCKDQISHYKIPHYIQFVEEFPLTPVGKVQKYKIRKMACKQLGIP